MTEQATGGSKKVLVLGLVAVAVVAGIMYVARDRSERVSRETLRPSEVPAGIPADLPLEGVGVALSENAELRAGDGREQSSRAFQSSRTLDEEVTRYEAYFAENGWMLRSAQVFEGVTVLLADRGEEQLSVTLTEREGEPLSISITSTSSR